MKIDPQKIQQLTSKDLLMVYMDACKAKDIETVDRICICTELGKRIDTANFDGLAKGLFDTAKQWVK